VSTSSHRGPSPGACSTMPGKCLQAGHVSCSGKWYTVCRPSLVGRYRKHITHLIRRRRPFNKRKTYSSCLTPRGQPASAMALCEMCKIACPQFCSARLQLSMFGGGCSGIIIFMSLFAVFKLAVKGYLLVSETDEQLVAMKNHRRCVPPLCWEILAVLGCLFGCDATSPFLNFNFIESQ